MRSGPECPHCSGRGRVLDARSATRQRCDYCLGKARVSEGDAAIYLAVRDGAVDLGAVFDSGAPALEARRTA